MFSFTLLSLPYSQEISSVGYLRGLETCFYPIFNDRAAKGASVANEG